MCILNFFKLSRQEVDGILSVVSTLLPPTESLAAAAKGGLLIPAVSIPCTGLSSHDDAGAQYSLYKYITSTLQSTNFNNLSSAVGVASNPSFLSWILSRTAWRFSKSCETKSKMESLGLRLLEVAAYLHSHVSRHLVKLAGVYCQGNTWPNRLKTGGKYAAATDAMMLVS